MESISRANLALSKFFVTRPAAEVDRVNDKGYQLALNPITHQLLVKGGYVKQGGEAA